MSRKIGVVILMLGVLVPAILFSQNTTTRPLQEEFQLTRNEARLTLLKSLVLPGWGEHSLGYNKRGYIFQGAELLCWTTYAAFIFLGKSKTKDMKAFAAEYAGVDPAGKDKDYFADIGKYDDIYQYNDARYRNRDLTLVYSDLDKYYWNWESEEKRKEFDDLRFNSGIHMRNATLATTALIINRVVSVLDIMSITSGHIESPEQRVRAHFTPGLETQKLSLSIDL